MVVGVVTLRIVLVEYEVAISHAIYTHVHDGLVAHAHSHAAIAAARPMALHGQGVVRRVRALALLSVFAGVQARPTIIIVVVVLWVAPRAFRTLVLQALLRAMQLGLFIRL